MPSFRFSLWDNAQRVVTDFQPCTIRAMGESFHEHMHMVWHDAPRVDLITLAVEVQEGVSHLLRQFRVAQGAAPHAGIEPLYDFFAPVCGALVFGEVRQLLFQ